jgi:large subunit ribosomal protein L4
MPTTTKKITAPVFSLEGKKIDDVELDPAVFSVEIATPLLTRAITAQRNNARAVLAHTKTRGERRGGGRKPWKQKGTGRARHGSIRSPQWKKGGIVFGPRNNRNFELKMNRKERQKAILGALSLVAARPSGVVLLEKMELPEVKAKKLATLITKLPTKRSVLLVLSKHDEKVELSARNIANLKTQLANNLNVMDLMRYRHVVMPLDAMKLIGTTYLHK